MFFGSRRRQSTSRQPARCPRGLEVESACDAVDIQYFTCEEEIIHNAALHGFEIHFVQVHAAAGDELFFEDAFAFDGKFACC